MPLDVDTHTVKLDVKDLNSEGEFSGYASVWDVVDVGRDVIKKGAFKKSIREKKAGNIRMLFQHDPAMPIGVWQEMAEDEKGLLVKGQLMIKVQKGMEVMELMKAKAIDGLSIGFRTVSFAYERPKKDDGQLGDMVRIIKEVDLWEVSVVTFPMNTEARIQSVKGEWLKRDVERTLRDAGMPNSFAKLVTIHGYDEAQKMLRSEQREADNGLNDVAQMLRQGLTQLRA